MINTLFFFLSVCLLASIGVTMAKSDEPKPSERGLDHTPTWAVAAVCAVIIIISISLEKVIHKLGTWFTEKHKKAMFDALEKVKAELMILGFISLLLTFGQKYIVKICIPLKVANTMLPCELKTEDSKSEDENNRRRLLWLEHRFLSSATTSACKGEKVPLISLDGLHDIHLLIFFLAVFHVVYTALVVMLGRLKCRSWKKWEQEISSPDYEFSNDPSRFRLTLDTTFVQAHTSFWTRIPFFFYIGCFFRQFFRSVSKTDYYTLRNGFISVHLAPGSKFDFQKYLKRTIEDDFKVIVGISPLLWLSFILLLLLNVRGWLALVWGSCLPLIIVLAVGTKLQAILTRMAVDIAERHSVVQGIPLVQLSDKYFWFGRPQLILHLLHFALFQNAFQITYFCWILYSFKMKSCFRKDFELAIAKVSIGLAILFICSYITIPLHALVSQMGSKMKRSIFDEQTSKALTNWHKAAKKNHGKEKKKIQTRTLGGNESTTPSTRDSSVASLHRYMTTGHSTRAYAKYNDGDVSDLEAEPLSSTSYTDGHPIVINDTQHDLETSNRADFSFAKPSLDKET